MRNQSNRHVLRLLLVSLFLAMVTAPGPAQAAAADCPNGYFCVWSGTSYTGTIRKFKTDNSYQQLNLSSIKSFYNRYNKRAWLHQTTNGSGSLACINPGQKSSNVTGWQATAKSVWLSTVTTC